MAVISRLGLRHCESGGQGQLRRSEPGLDRRIRPPIPQQASAGGVEPPGLHQRAVAVDRLAALASPALAAALHPLLHKILVRGLHEPEPML